MQRLVASTLFLLAIISTGAFTVHAQAIGGADTAPLTVTVNPDYPTPYQTVSVTPSSSAFDIAAATITVYVNGVSVYKGSGGQSVPVTVGGPGAVTTIKVSATNQGQTYTAQAVVRPASVALVVEPVSTAHPFYAGRPLVAPQGTVRVIAVPDVRTSANTAISPDALVYTWKFGDQILESASGIGKSVLTASAPEEYRDADITVTVSNQSQTINAQSVVHIAPSTPFIRIYENDPLMGPLFDMALSDTATMHDTETTYRAVPYYFSTTPTLNWTVNGVQSGSDNDITVRATGAGQGTANLDVSAKQDNPLETAAATLSVLFGQKKSGGIFGL